MSFLSPGARAPARACHVAVAPHDRSYDEMSSLVIKYTVRAELKRKRPSRTHAQSVAVRQREYVLRTLNSIANHASRRYVVKPSNARLELGECVIRNPTAFEVRLLVHHHVSDEA